MITKHRVLFIVLAIVGVLLTLQINGALAATPEDTPPVSSKLKKCGYEAGIPGIFEFTNEAGATVGGLFMTGDPTSITVMGEKSFDSMDKDGNPIKLKTYKFSASYDKPVVYFWCETHKMFEGPVPYVIYSQGLPPAALEGFYLPVEQGKCSD